MRGYPHGTPEQDCPNKAHGDDDSRHCHHSESQLQKIAKHQLQAQQNDARPEDAFACHAHSGPKPHRHPPHVPEKRAQQDREHQGTDGWDDTIEDHGHRSPTQAEQQAGGEASADHRCGGGGVIASCGGWNIGHVAHYGRETGAASCASQMTVIR